MARNRSIDIAKGIGIICVIGLHSGFHSDWMVSFEMPLFYLISGLFHKRDIDFKTFIIKNINTLLIPYLFFELPKWLYDLYYWTTHDVSLYTCISNSAIATTTWFLLSLFEVRIISFFVLRFIDYKPLILTLAVGFSFTGYLMSKFELISPLYLYTSISCVSYYLIGYMFNHKFSEVSDDTIYRLKCLIIGGGTLLACYFIDIYFNQYIFYRNNQLEGPWWSIVCCALLGSMGILFISKSIKNNRLLEFFGRYSLIVLGTHLYFIKSITGFGLHPAILFVTSVVFSFISVLFLKRFVPRLCGVIPLIQQNDEKKTHTD